MSTDVILIVGVGVDGHVGEVSVLQSGGEDADASAKTAVAQWMFEPALRDGVKVASRIRVPFHFEVQQKIAPSTATSAPVSSSAAATTSPPPVAPSTNPSAATPSTPITGAAPTTNDDEVTVRDHLQPRSVGAADYRVTVGELRAVPRANASDALKLAPGFLLTNEGGSGHAEQVYLRGFDAREGQDLEFSVDGVPINDAGNYHGNGYADTHFIIPELIHSIHVLEGPYAPQQGNFAVAGSADYQLGLDRRGLTTEYSIGNFGTQRLLLTYGPSDAPTGTFAGAEYYTTDGFGTNRQAKRGTAIGQYELPVGQRGSIRVTATAYFTEFNNAGIVRQDDYQSGKVGFYGTEDPNQTGNDASRASIAATYEARQKNIDLLQQVFVIDRTMRLRENFTGFIDDVQEPTQELHDQRGDLRDFHFDEVTFGGRGLARWHGDFLGLRQELEGGYFARLDTTSSTEFRVAAGSNAPYKTDADLDSTLGDVGVYVDANAHILPWLGLRGGVRADMFLFDVLNNCAVTSVDSPSKANPEIDNTCLSELSHGVYRDPFQRSTTADGAVMPRATLVVGPIRHFEFTGSIGDGVRSVDPSYVSQGLLTPFVNVQSRDLGVSYASGLGPSTSLTFKSSFFQTHADQDLVFNPTEGRSTLASGSTRTGWAGATRVVGGFFDFAANATLVRATFDDTHLLVPYVPDLVLRGDFALFHDLPWKIAHEGVRGTIGYGVSYVGHRALPYGDTSDIIFVSDASVGASWTIWTVRVSAQNLFDSKYKLGEYNYASDFHSLPEPTLAPERSFTAGAPRTVLLTLAATLGGK
jgi:TonB family protein